MLLEHFLANGPSFEPYLKTTLGVLRQAGAVEPNPVSPVFSLPPFVNWHVTWKLDYDLVDYVGQLREGILEAYTGIVTGLKKTEKSKPFIIYTKMFYSNALPLSCSDFATFTKHLRSRASLFGRRWTFGCINEIVVWSHWRLGRLFPCWTA